MNLGMTLRNTMRGPTDPTRMAGFDPQRMAAISGPPTPMAQPMQAQPAAPHKPGFFGDGGMGRYIAGILGDTLLQQSGGQAMFAPMMAHRQQQADEQAQWGLRRQEANDDWTRREQWKLANYPKPEDQFTRMMRAAGIDPASAQGRAMYQGKVTNEVDPIVTTMVGDRLISAPRSMIMGQLTGQANPGASTPSPSAIQHLRQNPNLRDAFESKYGPGSAAQYMGGGAGNGTGGFR